MCNILIKPSGPTKRDARWLVGSSVYYLGFAFAEAPKKMDRPSCSLASMWLPGVMHQVSTGTMRLHWKVLSEPADPIYHEVDNY